jgi:hypothetical protein
MPRPCAAVLLAACLPAAALAQPADAEYTRKIRAYTTDAMFLTELVDHLPASPTVPTPEKFHGYVAGAPERLTYAKDVHRYFRELARTSPRVRAWTMGTTEEGREQILVAISDVENLGRLERLKHITARLGDPRGLSPEEAKTLVAEDSPSTGPPAPCTRRRPARPRC